MYNKTNNTPEVIIMDTKKLPSQIKVKVVQEKSGVIFAELSDYGIFTEANNQTELIFNINNLIYSFFDIADKDRDKFWYLPSLKEAQKKQKSAPLVNPLFFHILTRPDVKYKLA